MNAPLIMVFLLCAIRDYENSIHGVSGAGLVYGRDGRRVDLPSAVWLPPGGNQLHDVISHDTK